MRNQITRFAALAVATVIGMAPLAAQDTQAREREIEERLRQLRQEMRELERELGRDRISTFTFSDDLPRVLSLSTNRAQLGVLVQTNADRDTDEIGALLESVTPGSPADEAGLQAGDIITSFNGESLTAPNPDARADESAPAMLLIDKVREMEPGDEVEITYQRDGGTRTTTATLRRMDGSGFAFSTLNNDDGRFDVRVAPRVRVRDFPRVDVNMESPELFVTSFFSGVWADIELVSLNEDLGQYFGTDEGLLVIKAPDADGINLRGGDVIISIDGRAARSPSRALRILRSYEAGEALSIEIMRDRQRMTVEMTVPESEWQGRMRERREYR